MLLFAINAFLKTDRYAFDALFPGRSCHGGDSCCDSDSPCILAEGDCDWDSDCASNLVCGTNNCVGSSFEPTDDCCTLPCSALQVNYRDEIIFCTA